MCKFSEIIAGINDSGGEIFRLQLITILAICASILLWVWVYKNNKTRLKEYIIPICLWIVFGTLDIVITVRGTFGNPMAEGNPLSRFIFTNFGWIGPVVASFVWICIWASIVLILNKIFRGTVITWFSLGIFYSLAIGHFMGFASWFTPLCNYAKLASVTTVDGVIVAIILGYIIGSLHTILMCWKKEKS